MGIACPAVVEVPEPAEGVETTKGEDVGIACPAVVEPVETTKGERHEDEESAHLQICIFPNSFDVKI